MLVLVRFLYQYTDVIGEDTFSAARQIALIANKQYLLLIHKWLHSANLSFIISKNSWCPNTFFEDGSGTKQKIVFVHRNYQKADKYTTSIIILVSKKHYNTAILRSERERGAMGVPL